MSSLPTGGDCMEYEMRDGAWAPVVSEELSQHFPFTQHLFTHCFIFASLDKIPLVLARSLLRCLARFRFYICPFTSTIILVVLWRHLFGHILFGHRLVGFLFIKDSFPLLFLYLNSPPNITAIVDFGFGHDLMSCYVLRSSTIPLTHI